jgi:hypothetical protein
MSGFGKRYSAFDRDAAALAALLGVSSGSVVHLFDLPANRPDLVRGRVYAPHALRPLASGAANALVAANRERPEQTLGELAALLGSAQRRGWALVALDCAAQTTTPPAQASATVLATFAPCERRGRPPQMSQHAIERDQTRTRSWQEPGRDRARTQRRPRPHRPGRAPLVPSHRPLHAQANTLTPRPVAVCGSGLFPSVSFVLITTPAGSRELSNSLDRTHV